MGVVMEYLNGGTHRYEAAPDNKEKFKEGLKLYHPTMYVVISVLAGPEAEAEP